MLPTTEDVQGIRDGMLRAQRTYEMSVERMTRGNVTFVEVLRMAQHASRQYDWPTACEWFELADKVLRENLQRGLSGGTSGVAPVEEVWAPALLLVSPQYCSTRHISCCLPAAMH